jgi:hypothetical protein
VSGLLLHVYVTAVLFLGIGFGYWIRGRKP